MDSERTSSAVSCAGCGTTADPAPLDWMSDRDSRRGQLWYCTTCQRLYLRSIEAKLPGEWW